MHDILDQFLYNSSVIHTLFVIVCIISIIYLIIREDRQYKLFLLK